MQYKTETEVGEKGIPTKVCSVCKVQKPITDFQKRKGYKYGVSCRCKKCDYEISKKCYHKKPEQYRLKAKNLRAKNKDRYNNLSRIRYHKDLEKHRKYSREWQANNPEKTFRRWLKSEYGITPEQYNEMFTIQNGLCAICGLTSTVRLCVDHNHETGKVRGLLCRICNTAIGFFNDSEETLLKAVEYLKK